MKLASLILILAFFTHLGAEVIELTLSKDKLAMQYVSFDASKRNASSADLTLKEKSKVLFAMHRKMIYNAF